MKKTKSYYLSLLLLVVLIWGFVPNVNKYLLNFYSPAIKSAFTATLTFVIFLFICRKKLKQLNRKYFLTAGITGLFYSLAVIMQSYGLKMATPVMMAFLENLSCIVVPVLVWVLTKNRPSVFKFIGALLCLFSVFVLSGGLNNFQVSFGIGELLCGLAGMFYGVNIAVTGIKAKEMDASLYLMIQFLILSVISSCYAFCFEKVVFSFSPLHLITIVLVVLISSVLCWSIRTVCVCKLDPVLVSVIMPFSAVITSIFSILLGNDVLSLSVVLGGVLGIMSTLVADFDPKRLKKRFTS